MIRVTITNEMLERIISINEYRLKVGMITLPPALKSRFRKNSAKKRAYSSNKMEGNPLTEKQASEVIESDPHRHFLQPEQEIRNYVQAIDYLEKQVKAGAPFDLGLILQVQALVEKGASKEKIGIRKPMPPGILFAVYDAFFQPGGVRGDGLADDEFWKKQSQDDLARECELPVF